MTTPTAYHKGDVTRLIREHLRLGQTAVDVGAAHGQVTQAMLDVVGPTGYVIAIEPRLLVSLGDLLSRYPRQLEVQNMAVGQGHRSAVLHLLEDKSTLWPKAVGEQERATSTLSVTVAPLDDLVTRPVDLIKIDVQGSEYDVLLGAERLLRECPMWILEVWPAGLAAAGHSVEELLVWLVEHDLTPHWADMGFVTEGNLKPWLRRQPFQGFVNWVCTRP